MQERTRTTVLVGLCLVLIVLVGVWWYFGFSLDFMRFFAAEPGAPRPGPTDPPPAGCYYQDVQCVQAPCPPVLVCPPTTGMVTCTPATQTVKVGAQAVLTAAGGDGRYAWLSPEGNPGTGFSSIAATDGIRSYGVTYATAGTKKVTVESTRRDSSLTVDLVACTVIVTP